MARTPTARRRRARRFTPRRWLPFLALIALVVGAAVIDSNAPTLRPDEVDASLRAESLPAVTSRDAISTAWYCAGGTAVGEGGRAELSVVLANDDSSGASAEVTVYDKDGPQGTKQVDVPAHGRARVVASEVAEVDWAGVLVEVRGGRVAVDREVSGPLGFDAGPCSTSAAARWYVPSGSTLRGAEEYVALFNPFPDTASVNITFATNSGPREPRSLRSVSVPGQSVRMIKVGDTVTNRSAIAATVRARSGRVIVDRVQTYDGEGDEVTGSGPDAVTTPAPKGLISTAAIAVRAPRWVFPGSRVSEGVRSQVAIYNPGSTAAEVDVAVSYQDPGRFPGVEPIGVTVRPHAQAIVDLTDIPDIQQGIDMWVDVRSLDGVPVVAERLSFLGAPSKRIGAAVSAGSPITATRWMVTQAGATRLRSATVQVANPGSSSAKVRVFVLSAGDRSPLQGASITIPKRDRRTLDLSEAGPASTIIVVSSKPVVVGSSMSLVDGLGIAVAPAFPYPETVVALPPLR